MKPIVATVAIPAILAILALDAMEPMGNTKALSLRDRIDAKTSLGET